MARHISYTDAFFETMSGITTTGSTVFSGLDQMSPGILIWRSLLHWLGGIGFIGMAVAILPLLRVGGMRLFQTESSDWGEKVMPRSHMAAKYILGVYVALTLLGVLCFWWAGMTPSRRSTIRWPPSPRAASPPPTLPSRTGRNRRCTGSPCCS